MSDQDVYRLWEWANEPGTRASSFRSDPIPWEEHLEWFARKCADAQCRMYILEADGLPAGQVRFDIGPDGVAEVHVSLAAGSRGRGYGTVALRLGAARLFTDTNCAEVVAHIKAGNAASIRAFEKAGFRPGGARRVGNAYAVRMSLKSGETR